jgi:hypothetical protein
VTLSAQQKTANRLCSVANSLEVKNAERCAWQLNSLAVSEQLSQQTPLLLTSKGKRDAPDELFIG